MALSDDVNRADVDLALHSGMNDYVTKPIKQDDWFNAIYKTLNGAKSQYGLHVTKNGALRPFGRLRH